MNEDRVEPAVLHDGFERARSRFVNSQPGTAEAFQAIFEALAWVGVIRHSLVSEDLRPPAIVDGLYYMRNVVLHQGADVLHWLLIPSGKLGAASLGTMKLGGGGPSRKPQWPAVGDFKAPESRTGKEEYRTMLAGTSVVDTLDDAVSSLRGVWGLSGDAAD